jgi:hypothetical protein
MSLERLRGSPRGAQISPVRTAPVHPIAVTASEHLGRRWPIRWRVIVCAGDADIHGSGFRAQPSKAKDSRSHSGRSALRIEDV